jgi:PiT family inorganic phosphate transporter
MAADSSSAAVILLSSHFGYALSTTHVATGSILGSGLGKPGAEVRWGVAGRMATAWLITLPAAGTVGAIIYFLVHSIGGYAGGLVGFALLLLTAGLIYLQSRKAPVTHKNVNDDWQVGLHGDAAPAAPVEPESAPKATQPTAH